MRIKKLIPFVLMCLLALETPLVSQAKTLTEPEAVTNPETDSDDASSQEPGLTLPSSKTIYLKNPVTLDAVATPQGTITWKSSNRKVATVNSKGKITPKSTGTTVITASCNGLQKKCTITVKNPSVKLKEKNLIIFAEADYSLNTTARPSSSLSYRSSNPKVAKVSKDGTLKGIRPGTATITASVPGAKAASCEVTVLKNNHKLNRSSLLLMEGTSADIYITNTSPYDYVSYSLSDWSVAKLKTSGNTCKVTARQAGETTLTASYSTYKDGQNVTCTRSCTINVIDSGIVQQEISIAAGSAKNMTFRHPAQSDTAVTDISWKSSNPDVAVIDHETGKVKGISFGSAQITADVSYSDGSTRQYTSNIQVSKPAIKSKYTVIALNQSQKIGLNGSNPYSSITWKLKKKSLASVSPDGIITAGSTAGKTTLTINVDGKTITHTIEVTNPVLKNTFVAVSPNETAKIELSGVSAHSKVTYRSRKKSVATVSTSGVVTAHKYGTANITVVADGNAFTFQVNVAPKRAVDACRTGYSIMYSSSYSQALRMSTGYYDCSSLVFRSYGCDTGLLGGIPSWAPTAAAMASYMERTGKVIAYRAIDSSKLRPGDIIFYSGPPNGRYKNINHVSMYYGGGYRLEKPLREYYREYNTVMIARPVR